MSAFWRTVVDDPSTPSPTTATLSPSARASSYTSASQSPVTSYVSSIPRSSQSLGPISPTNTQYPLAYPSERNPPSSYPPQRPPPSQYQLQPHPSYQPHPQPQPQGPPPPPLHTLSHPPSSFSHISSPPQVVPASPHTSAAEYGRHIPYPSPLNLPHSQAFHHPTVLYEQPRPGPSTRLELGGHGYPGQGERRGYYEHRRVEGHEAERERGRDRAREREGREEREEPRARAPSPEPSPYQLREEESADPPVPAPAEGDMYADFFEEVAGRRVPRRPCVYGLPIDDEERTRLDIGHRMIFMAQPGLFLGPANEVLDPSNSGEAKRVLDIGTGNGTWAKEVADQHPRAEIDVIDLVPPTRPLPETVVFYRRDVNHGLTMSSAHYDLVHARNIQLGIPDYPKLIADCARVLKPRGLINLIEGDWDIFDSDGNPVTLYKNPGWFNWIQAWRNAVQAKNIDLAAPMKTEQVLKESPYFTEVKATARWMPVGPWTNDATMNKLGEVVWENLKYLIPSIRPLLIDYYRGDPQLADMIVQHAWAELASPHAHVFMRWRFVSARRNNRVYNAEGPPPRRSRKGKEPARERPASGSAPSAGAGEPSGTRA